MDPKADVSCVDCLNGLFFCFGARHTWRLDSSQVFIWTSCLQALSTSSTVTTRMATW